MKNKINLIIDIVAFVAFLISSLTGIILWRVFPTGGGFRGGGSLTGENIFLGLLHRQWSVLHIYASLIFLALILTHLIFHWTWIKNMPRLFKS